MKKYDFLRVGIGGAIGAGIRWLVIETATTSTVFPWPTLLVNLIGCAALGIFIGKKIDKRSLLMLGTGFCGGLTTFSTFSFELVILLRDHEIFISLCYLLTSIIFGVIFYKATSTICERNQ